MSGFTSESERISDGGATLSFRGGQKHPPVLLYTKTQLPELASYQVMGELYIVENGALPVSISSGDTILHVDGIGVYNDQLIESPSDLQQFSNQNLIQIFGNTRGAVAGYSIDLERKVTRILPDPLGGAIIYRYKAHGVEMLSTSMSAITTLARHLKLSLTRSPTWFAELIAAESGGFGAESSYEEIGTLPAGTYLEGDENSTRVIQYDSSVWDELGATQPSSHLLDQIVHEITSNARAFGKRKGSKTAHLSAGGDSRLSAATLVREGIADDFNFYCAGNSISREYIIAGEVAQHLGLRLTDDSGLRTPVVPRTAFESVAVALLSSEGMKHYAPFKSTLGSDGLILTGMYGGNLRAFYSSGLERIQKKDGRSVLSAIWNNRLQNPENGILSDEAIQATSAGIDKRLAEARDRGISEDALGDYLYASVRQRYFGAHTLMETSRYVKQGSVLYSPTALKYSLASPLREREGGKLVYDLYQHILPAALEIRFDSEKFDDSILTNPTFPTRVTYPPKELPPSGAKMVPERANFGVTPKASISKSDKIRARKLGLPAWRIAYEPISRAMIADWVKDSPEKARRTFDLRNLTHLIDSPCTSKSEIKLVTRIASYLPWFAAWDE